MSAEEHLTSSVNAWALRAGLMNTWHTRHIQKLDGSGYVVFLGSTKAEVDRKYAEGRHR